MQSAMTLAPVSNMSAWVGRVVSALAAAFMIFDGVIKVMMVQPVIESFGQLGFPVSTAVGIGVLSLACIAVYLVPRTAVLGAVLLTGYLGGAIATHVRAESGVFPLVFPLIIGAMLWGGLYLRDARLRALVAAQR
jgi:hypothetical protein